MIALFCVLYNAFNFTCTYADLFCFYIFRVANNGLPATLAIHKALKEELDIDSRLGATFGKIYCGVVGGIRRHSFNIIGAPVNLAARLMASKMNNGILVDEAVVKQVKTSSLCPIEFRGLSPIHAKGYAMPVPVFVPVGSMSEKSLATRSTFFVGRKVELQQIVSVVCDHLSPSPSSSGSIIILGGESGVGKTSFGLKAIDEVKKFCSAHQKKVFASRTMPTETEYRAPFMYVELSLHIFTFVTFFSSDHNFAVCTSPDPFGKSF